MGEDVGVATSKVDLSECDSEMLREELRQHHVRNRGLVLIRVGKERVGVR